MKKNIVGWAESGVVVFLGGEYLDKGLFIYLVLFEEGKLVFLWF